MCDKRKWRAKTKKSLEKSKIEIAPGICKASSPGNSSNFNPPTLFLKETSHYINTSNKGEEDETVNSQEIMYEIRKNQSNSSIYFWSNSSMYLYIQISEVWNPNKEMGTSIKERGKH